MDRECTPDCVAYSTSVEEMFEGFCDDPVPCLRLFTELAQSMLSNPAYVDDDDIEYV
jgi:hypothetical protein